MNSIFLDNDVKRIVKKELLKSNDVRFRNANINELRVGQNTTSVNMSVYGNEIVRGNITTNTITLNNVNSTTNDYIFDMYSSTDFPGSVSIVDGSAVVTGKDTFFKKFFKTGDIIIIATAEDNIYGVVNTVPDETSIVCYAPFTNTVENAPYFKYIVNVGTCQVTDGSNSVIGTNTLFKKVYRQGDSFITYYDGNIVIKPIDLVFDDTTIFCNSTFSFTETNLSSFTVYSYDVINQAGNLGLGDTDPQQKLSVNGDINFTGILYQNGIPFSGTTQWTSGPGNVIYYNEGNVGIGTATPITPLQVVGTTTTDVLLADSIGNAIRLQTPLTTGYSNILFSNNSGANNYALVGKTANASIFNVDSSYEAASQLILKSGSAGVLVNSNNGIFNLTSGTGAINIGGDISTKTITIGNSTASPIYLNSGIGSIYIGSDNAFAHTVQIGNSTNCILNLFTGSGALNIGTDNINSHTITIGNSTSSPININPGIGALNIGTDAPAHIITIGNSIGSPINLLSGTGALNIGTDSAIHNITIGNSIGSPIGIYSGTSDLDIGSDLNSHNIYIGNDVGATLIDIQAGSAGVSIDANNGPFNLTTGTGDINIGTDLYSKQISIGNDITTTGVSIESGTSGIILTTANNGNIDIDTDGVGQTTIVNTTDSSSTSSGAFVVSGGVGIAKNLYVGGDLNIAGTITLGNVTVANLTVTNDETIGGTLIVTGATTLSNTLGVTGLITANGGITVPTGQAVAIQGTSTLTVGTGATTLGGTLNVTGISTLTGLLNANGGIAVPTAQSVVINGTSTLTVGTGATTLGGVLNVTGLSTLSGGITVPTGTAVAINGTSTLTVGTGATTLGGTLSVTGATTLSNTLVVTGLTTLNGGITVPTGQAVAINGTSTLTVGTGATTLGGVLNVTGLSTLSGGITVPTGTAVAINGTSTLTVGTGATTLGGVLNVTGLSTLSGGITVPTGQTVAINGTSTLSVGGGVTIGSGSIIKGFFFGTGTVGAGNNTVTVANTNVKADSKIFLTMTSVDATASSVSLGTITAGASFVVNSDVNTTGAFNFNYMIINVS